MLLNALLTDAELRGEMIGALRSLRDDRDAAFAAHLPGHFRAGRSRRTRGLRRGQRRLEEADQNLLAQAVLNEDGEISREEVMAAVESMQRSERQQPRGQLKTRISESERAGSSTRRMRLTDGIAGAGTRRAEEARMTI